jgi:hypothetical protein
MKFCKDCIHCVPADAGLEYATCDLSTTVNLVTGNVKRSYCEAMRMAENSLCGKEARGFQPILEVA